MGIEKIKPIEDVILVRPDYHKEKVRKSGVIIPNTVENKTLETGTIIAVGPGKKNQAGNYIPIPVSVGQKIIYYISSAYEIIEVGEKYHFVDDTVALAVYDSDLNLEIN